MTVKRSLQFLQLMQVFRSPILKVFIPTLTAFLLLRLGFWLAVFPNPDEAYYWLWGQYPAWSYYDHPPLHAWIQGLFTTLFGRSHLTLRLPNLLTNGIFFYIYYQIARYLYGKQAQNAFWIMIACIVASPLYFLFLALAWQDHLLITFSLLSAYWLIQFLDRYLMHSDDSGWQLYGAAIALGLAGLCKYNAAFMALGFLATIGVEPRLRPLLRDRRLYVAAAIGLSCLLPVLLWNLSNDWQSLQYYFNRSVNPVSGFSLKFSPFFNFVLFSFLLVSPFNWILFWRSWRQSTKLFSHSIYPTIAVWTLIIPTVTLTFISLLSAALYYWNITAYLLLFPLIPALFLSPSPSSSPPFPKFLIAGQLYGLLFATLLVIHYGLLPISALVSSTEDPDSRMLYGWDTVAAEVSKQATELGNPPLLVTTDYRSASALAYALNNPTVMAISDRVDQFDFWLQPNQYTHKNALILSDDWHPIQSDLLARFERIAEPKTISVRRFGIWIKHYYLRQAFGYKG
ncbi:ArnT family glycosyltransferase [Pantanalinema sp. GBBB05]|uniref:ArnT family glycosyltransferase n=1 Tax=Pantanalinema sp. GBBB05 TaxID=2604139 RepID=UPI003D814B67